MRLLAAKVALRLSGHDAAALMGGAADAAPAMMPMAAAPVPQMGMEMGKEEMKMDKEKKMKMDGSMGMEMGEREKKMMKLQNKIKERDMELVVYKGELAFIEGLEAGGERPAGPFDSVARDLIASMAVPVNEHLSSARDEHYCASAAATMLPDHAAADAGVRWQASCGDMERMEMEKELTMKLEKVSVLPAEERGIRGMKVQEKIMKCTRKIRECKMELGMMEMETAGAAC